MDDLLARVQALLQRMDGRQAESPLDKMVTCGPLELEPGTYLAMLHGAPLNLARAEFDLIYLMVTNPGRVFTRPYLIEKIWGARFAPGDRSIDNLVLRLRKKLGPFGAQIEAVWGEGYRLRPSETDPNSAANGNGAFPALQVDGHTPAPGQ
jgi:DNA-binding response OmpR family regulator